jgi:hypothetical protein
VCYYSLCNNKTVFSLTRKDLKITMGEALTQGFQEHAQREAKLHQQLVDNGFQPAETLPMSATPLPTAEMLNTVTAQTLANRERANSADVAALNDAAEIAIYGSRGQTAGYTDAAGKPLHAPIKGRVDRILESPRWGTSTAERQANAPKAQAAAKEYGDNFEKIVGEGFERCQAKIILDRREQLAGKLDKADRQHRSKVDKNIRLITDQYIKNGDTPADARAKAEARVARRKLEAEGSDINPQTEESKLKNLIRTKGIFTVEELNRAEHPKPSDDDMATKPGKEKEKDLTEAEKILYSLTLALNTSRARYAGVSARRARGHGLLSFGKKHRELSKKSVAEARKNYERDSKGVILHEVNMATKAGVSTEDLKNYAEQFAIGETERMVNALYRKRQLATGQYEYEMTEAVKRDEWGRPIDKEGKLVLKDKNGKLNYFYLKNGRGEPLYELEKDKKRREPITKEIEPKTSLDRAVRKFYRWWDRQTDTRLFSTATFKKSATLAAVGVAVGVPAGLAGTVLLGPIAGGAVGALAASKIAKGVMANQINKRAYGGPMYIDRLSQEALNSVDAGHAIGNVIDKQTRKEVNRNRRRLVGSIAATALSGTVAAVGAEQLDIKDKL